MESKPPRVILLNFDKSLPLYGGSHNFSVEIGGHVHSFDALVREVFRWHDTVVCIDVADISVGQMDVWQEWLGMFYERGARGVIAPWIRAHPNWSGEFLYRFLREFYIGKSIGEALLNARIELWVEHDNPLGLTFAHYGPADYWFTPPVEKILTRRQYQVLSLLGSGDSDEEIGYQLGIQPATVTNHILNIINRLNISDRVAAIHYAQRHGLVLQQAA
jgi:DNA-binding CsgD family transcriptional regulator